MTHLEKEIYDTIEPIINSLDYELYDVIYEKEGRENHLKVFIDSSNGIDINDCEKVNDAINDILDSKDFIKDQYYLEVSSTGLEKRIRLDKHFEKFKNTKVHIYLFKPINKAKELIGELEEFDNDTITIRTNEESKIINKKDISKITTYYDFSKDLGGIK